MFMRQSSLAIAFAAVPRRRSARALSAPPRAGENAALAPAAAAPVGAQRGGAAVRPCADSGAGHWIRLRLGVASAQVFALRQTLHRALGEVARIYVVEVDHRHGDTILHIDVARGGRDAAMHAIMSALPAAEFGVTTVLGSEHGTH